MPFRPPLVALAIAAAALAACATRRDAADSASADSMAAESARGAETAGDVTTTPATGNAAPDTGTKRAPATPATITPDRGKTTRDPGLGRDGNREQVPEVPPIHRTPYPGGTTPPAGGDRISALVAEIRALARADGCKSAGDCQTMPIGHKACGGPREYVVYCAASTDVNALRARAAELERLDREAARGMVSDCRMVTRPTVTLAGGTCRAAAREQAEPVY